MPDDLEYLWGWFVELDVARPEGFAGLAPITHEAIRAWSLLTGIEPDPLEVEALLLLDQVVRNPGEYKPPEPVDEHGEPVDEWKAYEERKRRKREQAKR